VTSENARPAEVFFDHDGGVDDFLSLLMLLSYDHVRLLGISITPADTLIEGALPATRKILGLAGRTDVEVAGGTLEGPNPFPLAWRLDSLKVNDLPVLNQQPAPPAGRDVSGQELLGETLRRADEPVTLLMTGPLTNLAWALDQHPEVEQKIAEVVFMGGALEVDGNVRQPGHDGTAEWNIYWDPPAAKRVFDSKVPLTMFSLDVTDRVPVTEEFRQAFGRQYGYPFSAVAGTIWAMTSGWELATGLPYFCWDTLTTSYLSVPELCTFREVGCDVVPEGPSQGRTVVTPEGRHVKIAADVDADRFYQHCLDTLKR
jgi:purine nucleosidase